MFDLEDEYSESDIPTTLIRSKADCPTTEVQERGVPVASVLFYWASHGKRRTFFDNVSIRLCQSSSGQDRYSLIETLFFSCRVKSNN